MKQSTHREPEDSSFELTAGEAFVRGEATLGVVSVKPFDDVCACVEESFAQSDMQIVHRHDLDRMLRDAGQVSGWRCCIFEIFDPKFAQQLVKLDASLAHVLPWRISVHASEDLTTVTMAMPTIVITEFAHEIAVGRLARRFESALQDVLRSVAARAASRA